MNRTVLIARIAAVVMLLVFILLLGRLHTRLSEMEATQPVADAPSDPG